MEFGVQLFGLMPQCRRDPEALFKGLAHIGYRQAEPCVAFGNVGGFEKLIWTPEAFERHLPMLQKNALRIPSCHVFVPDLADCAGTLADFATRHAIPQLVLNCPSTLTSAACADFAKACGALAEELQKVNVALLLHSNAADSAVRFGEVCAYEWILDACFGALFAQPDVGWLLYGGVDPAAFLQRKAALVKSLHYKDVRAVAGEAEAAQSNVRLGLGKLDVRACCKFACEAGIPQIVDQDVDNGDIMGDMDASLRLLTALAGA